MPRFRMFVPYYDTVECVLASAGQRGARGSFGLLVFDLYVVDSRSVFQIYACSARQGKRDAVTLHALAAEYSQQL